MGTRSTIAIIREDNTVSQVYCNWDGYVSHNGVILFNYYQDVDKINKLMTLGDISSLQPELIPKGYHTFDKPEENVTIVYSRDRGEKLRKAENFKNMKEFLSDGDFEGYNYVYKEKTNKWYLLDRYELKLKALKGLIKKELPNISLKHKTDFFNLIEQQKEDRKAALINEQVVKKLKV